MVPTLIQTTQRQYALYLERDIARSRYMGWKGNLIEVQYFDEQIIEYQCRASSMSTLEIDDARVMFEFSYCWRGVWEGCIYFKDEEYWSLEIKQMAEAWDKVESIVKQLIKSENPDYKYFDE